MRRLVPRFVALAAVAALGVALGAQQPASGPVTAQEIAAGLPADGSRWVTFGGAYTNHRHSPLTQITPENVNRLVPQWMFQTDTLGAFETTTLFRDNVLYVTGPQNLAWAIDARTGRQIWRYRRELPPQGTLTACCGLVNKGFGILGDRLFMVTLDAHLLALDTRTGAVVWDATMADYTQGYASTIAPLVVKDKVIVGIAGGEYGIRGFIDAYDAQTGKRAWRFYTIPGPGEPGNETWASDSWRRGGAGVWVTGAHDPELNLVYFGIGNPGPDYHSDSRKGDNLYSDSIVALDADTGTLKWHYQFTPHDVHDWDSTHVPILADLPIGGQPRKVVMMANRNGFFYTLDRTNGRLIVGKPYRADDVGEGDWRRRPAGAPPRAHAGRERLAHLPRHHRRDQLLADHIRPGAAALLRQRARGLRGLLRVEAGLHTRRALYRWRGAACARDARGRGAARAGSRDGRAQVGVQVPHPGHRRAVVHGLRDHFQRRQRSESPRD